MLTKDDDLYYFYGEVNMGNVARYINSSIYYRGKENKEYELYPRGPTLEAFEHDLAHGKEYGKHWECV